MKDVKCSLCGKKGHVRERCQVQIMKDTDGNPVMRIDEKPRAGIDIRAIGDVNRTQRLQKAENIIATIKNIAKKQAEKAASNRIKKKKKPKNTAVNLAEENVVDNEGDSDVQALVAELMSLN